MASLAEFTEFIEARLAEWEHDARTPETDNGMCDDLIGVHLDREQLLRLLASWRLTLALHRSEPGQHPDFCWHDKHELPCPTQRLVGMFWEDHPDYRPEWAPYDTATPT